MAPRPLQVNVLKKLSARWNKARVIVLNVPTGGGKSAIAHTISTTVGSAAIITPTKLLVNQYAEEYQKRGLFIMRGKVDYYCKNFKCSVSMRPLDLNQQEYCGPYAPFCPGCYSYQKDKRLVQDRPIICANYFTYLAHKLYRDTLVVDEAHKLIQAIQQFSSFRIWQWETNYPANVVDRYTLGQWLKDRPGLEGVKEEVYEDLKSRSPKLLFSRSLVPFRGEDRDCIDLSPLNVTNAPPFFWPDSVKKIILMSATINRKDIEELGLSDHQVAYITETSPILKNRRPVLAPAFGGVNMSVRYIKSNLPQFIKVCQGILSAHPKEKGLIHCSYKLAEIIRENYSDSRLMFHIKNTKNKIYQEFRESDPEEGRVLVASGMYEGIDLPYEYGRWQIIAKVPWPYLGEPVIKFKAKEDSDYYVWETIKTILQACGRVVRSPDDYGVTYIVDSTFRRLYTRNLKFFPAWFRDSVRFLDNIEWDKKCQNESSNLIASCK